MSYDSYRGRDPRCKKTYSYPDSTLIVNSDKSSITCIPSPNEISRPCPGLMEKEYDPESPVSDINFSPISANRSEVDPSPVPAPFLACAVCGTTPSSTPLYGCELSHIVCTTCRSVGGSLLSCPRCGSQDINHHLTIAEELLEAEQKKNCLVFCPFKVEGCNTVTRKLTMNDHEEQCLFRPIKCPKAMFSTSCSHVGPFCTIQQHGRDKHSLHHGVTVLELGVISSKMFDKGTEKTCCDDLNNAKFQPLELLYGENLFYCYFERVAERCIWFFFIRIVGNLKQASKFRSNISVGHAGLERSEMGKARLNYSGPVAHYDMRRDEIRGTGMVLAVPDEVLRACKVDNILFRVWFKVEKIDDI